ncbi:unnamed protein product [Ixodes persulcatus]
MTHPIEFAVFALFTITVIGLGLVLSFKRTVRLTIEEMFLGSRTLRVVPLALSALASIMSSTGIIAMSAHFYAYGLHMGWTTSVAVLLLIPVTVHVIVPVLYRLKITSVFEYLRARYCNKISLTACFMYFIVTVSYVMPLCHIFYIFLILFVFTVFQFPFLWSCLAIGLTGTIYTALHVLRGGVQIVVRIQERSVVHEHLIKELPLRKDDHVCPSAKTKPLLRMRADGLGCRVPGVVAGCGGLCGTARTRYENSLLLTKA